MIKLNGKECWFWERESYDRYQDRVGPSRHSDYPKNTKAAVSELRNRGIEVTYRTLRYAVSKEAIGAPGGGVGRGGLEWGQKHIDAAAEYFAGQGMFMPRAVMCEWLNLSFGQLMHAMLDACETIGPRGSFL